MSSAVSHAFLAYLPQDGGFPVQSQSLSTAYGSSIAKVGDNSQLTRYQVLQIIESDLKTLNSLPFNEFIDRVTLSLLFLSMFFIFFSIFHFSENKKKTQFSQNRNTTHIQKNKIKT